MTPRRATPSAPDSAEPAELGAPYSEWDAFPTRAEIKALGRRAAHAARQGALAAWKAAHPELNPQASDQTVEALIYLHSWGGATARDSRNGQTKREEPNA